MSGAVGDQHAISAGPPLSWPSHALLDDSAAQVGIDKPRSARATAWLRLLSVICSLRANRVNHLVLKIHNRFHNSNALYYSTINYNFSTFFQVCSGPPFNLDA